VPFRSTASRSRRASSSNRSGQPCASTSRRFAAVGLPPPATLTGARLAVRPASWPFLRSRRQMLGNAPAINVVVCTRDRAEQLQTCLHRLKQLEYPRFGSWSSTTLPPAMPQAPWWLAGMGSAAPYPLTAPRRDRRHPLPAAQQGRIPLPRAPNLILRCLATRYCHAMPEERVVS
jgi:hypothetical protein